MKKWSSYIASCLPLLAVLFLLFSNTASAQSVNQTSAQHTASANRALMSQCQYTDSTCTGQNPFTTLAPDGYASCWAEDGRALQTVNITSGTVTIYWSSACGTNWAVTYNSSNNYYIANANITRSDGVREDGTWYTYNASDPGGVWSPMVFAPVLAAQGCGSINNWTGGCTGWW